MNENEEQIILDIKVNYEDAITQIANYRAKIDELTDAKRNLETENKKLSKTEGENSTQMMENRKQIEVINTELKQEKDAVRELSKELQNNIKQDKARAEQRDGSLKALRAQLSNLTKQYDELGEKERSLDLGKTLEQGGIAAQIVDTTNKIKEAEEATLRFYRNVGNYEGSVKPLRVELKELVAQMSQLKLEGKDSGEEYQRLAKRAGEIKDAMADASAEVNQLASDTGNLDAILQTMTTGGGVFEAATGAMELFGAESENVEEAQRKLQATMAVVQGLTAIQNNLQRESALMLGVSAVQTWALQKAKLAEAAATRGGTVATIAATAAQKAFNLIAKANPYVLLATAIVSVVGALALFSRGSKEAERAQKALDEELANTREQIDRIKSESDFNIEIAKAAGASEAAIRRMRLEAARAALALADLQLDRAMDNGTQEQIQQAQEQSKQAWQGVLNVLRDNTIAEVKARNESNKKRTAAITRGGNDAANAQKEAAKTEREAIRQAEDELLKMVTDNIERERREINLQYDRQIEDLRTRLNTEKTLTVKAREAINKTIIALEYQKAEALRRLSDEEVTKRIENEQKIIQNTLITVKQGSEQQLELKRQQLANEESLEVAQAEREVSDADERERLITSIHAKYTAERKKLDDDAYNANLERQQQAIELRYKTSIAESGNNELESLRLNMEMRKELLDNAQQQEGESLEAFNLRRLEMENAYQQAKQELANKEVQIEQGKLQAIAGIAYGIGQVFEAMGEDNEAFAKLSKVLALAEIAINTGKAIAAGVAQAQSVPYPANLAAIATTVATILANIATALKTVKSAKFAEGGTVFGAGSGTSDSIHARLSNGESVNTAQATSMFSPLLSALNQIGGGVPITSANPQQQLGEDMLANAFARGAAMMPRPVVSVEEINNTNERVQVLERLSRV
jgi:hypothetical protein